MKRQQAAALLENQAIVRAYAEGKEIEFRPRGNTRWEPDYGGGFKFDFLNYEYRIKPEVEPFKPFDLTIRIGTPEQARAVRALYGGMNMGGSRFEAKEASLDPDLDCFEFVSLARRLADGLYKHLGTENDKVIVETLKKQGAQQ